MISARLSCMGHAVGRKPGAAAMSEFAREFPQAPLQPLRALIRNVHREREQQKPPKSFRALFKSLRDIIAP